MIYIKQFFVILNILASRRGWTFGEIFRGFEEKTRFHQVRETEREFGVKLRNDAKIAIFSGATLFLELKLIEIYIFIHYHFYHRQNWSKSSRFFAYHFNGYNKLNIVNLRLPKIS